MSTGHASQSALCPSIADTLYRLAGLYRASQFALPPVGTRGGTADVGGNHRRDHGVCGTAVQASRRCSDGSRLR